MTETEIERLVVRLIGDQTSYQSMMREADSTLQTFASHVRSYGTMVAAMLGVTTLAQTATSAISLAANLEQVSISFETMLGSATRAKAMLKDIQVYAAATPFEQAPLRQSAQMLMNYGIAAQQIMPTLKMLGEVSAGDQNKLNGLSYAFAQMSARGRVAGDDLRQMVNWGFNPLQEMARTTGKSMGTLTEMMHEGKITIDMLKGAFASATAEGGRFHGMMEKQSKTLIGLWSTAKDEISFALTEIGNQLIRQLDLKKTLEDSIKFVQTLSQFVKDYGERIIAVTVALTKFMLGWLALKTAVWVAMSALAAYRTLLQATVLMEVLLKSVQGPAGWAQLAAGLALAATVGMQLSSQFEAIDKNARDAAKGVKEVGNAVKGLDDRKPEQVMKDIALAMRQLAKDKKALEDVLGPNQKAVNIPKKANDVLKEGGLARGLGLQLAPTQLSETQQRVILLKNTLNELNTVWSKTMDPVEVGLWRAAVTTALGEIGNEVSGATEMLKREKDELRKTQEELDPTLVRVRMQAEGATQAILDQIDKTHNLTIELKGRAEIEKQIQEIQNKERGDRSSRAQQLTDSVMGGKEKMNKELAEYQNLFSRGLLSQETMTKLTKQAKDEFKRPVQSMLDSLMTNKQKLKKEVAEINKLASEGLLTEPERRKLVNKATQESNKQGNTSQFDSARIGSREASAHIEEYTMGATVNPMLVAANKTNDKLDGIKNALDMIKASNQTMAGEPSVEIRQATLATA